MGSPEDAYDYEHGYYGPYTPQPGEEWSQIEPRVDPKEIPKMMAMIIDTTSIRDYHNDLKLFVEFGVLDFMMESTQNQTVRDKLSNMKTEYVRVGEELKRIEERNHNLHLMMGNGLQNKDGTAMASPNGVSHQNQQGQFGYHNPQLHGPIYGQPGMPYQNPYMYHQQQQQQPLLKTAGTGILKHFTGIDLGGQPQPQYPPPGYPYPPPQYPPPY